jgi:hypothetical protein
VDVEHGLKVVGASGPNRAVRGRVIESTSFGRDFGDAIGKAASA